MFLLYRKTEVLKNKPANAIVEKEKKDIFTLIQFVSHTCEPKTIHSTRHDAGFENPFWDMKVKGMSGKSKDYTGDIILTDYVIPQIKRVTVWFWF